MLRLPLLSGTATESWTFAQAVEQTPTDILAGFPATVAEYLQAINTGVDDDEVPAEARAWSENPVALATLGITAAYTVSERTGQPVDLHGIPALQILAARTARVGKAAVLPDWWFGSLGYLTTVHHVLKGLDPSHEIPADANGQVAVPSARLPYRDRGQDVTVDEGQFTCSCNLTKWVDQFDDDDQPWYVCVRCGLPSMHWAVTTQPERVVAFVGGPLDGIETTVSDMYLSNTAQAKTVRSEIWNYQVTGTTESDNIFEESGDLVWTQVALTS